jgi:hypothetical protein
MKEILVLIKKAVSQVAIMVVRVRTIYTVSSSSGIHIYSPIVCNLKDITIRFYIGGFYIRNLLLSLFTHKNTSIVFTSVLHCTWIVGKDTLLFQVFHEKNVLEDGGLS